MVVPGTSWEKCGRAWTIILITKPTYLPHELLLVKLIFNNLINIHFSHRQFLLSGKHISCQDNRTGVFNLVNLNGIIKPLAGRHCLWKLGAETVQYVYTVELQSPLSKSICCKYNSNRNKNKNTCMWYQCQWDSSNPSLSQWVKSKQLYVKVRTANYKGPKLTEKPTVNLKKNNF